MMPFRNLFMGEPSYFRYWFNRRIVSECRLRVRLALQLLQQNIYRLDVIVSPIQLMQSVHAISCHMHASSHS